MSIPIVTSLQYTRPKLSDRLKALSEENTKVGQVLRRAVKSPGPLSEGKPFGMFQASTRDMYGVKDSTTFVAVTAPSRIGVCTFHPVRYRHC